MVFLWWCSCGGVLRHSCFCGGGIGGGGGECGGCDGAYGGGCG